MAMNHSRHLVSWYGVAGMGGVLHTVNPRLFEISSNISSTTQRTASLLYDAAFQPIVDKMRERWTTVEHYICYDSVASTATGLRRLDRRAGRRFRVG